MMEKHGKGCMHKHLGVALLLALGLSGCGDRFVLFQNDAGAPAGSVVGIATLEGADDSSGSVVFLAGTGYSTHTAGDGSFTIADVPPGGYTVVARHAGYENASAVANVVVGEDASVTLSLKPILVGSNTGAVAGTATLEATAAGTSDNSGTTVFLGGTGYVAQTAADGSFTMTNVLAGTYTAVAVHSGYESARAEVTVVVDQTATVTLVLKKLVVAPENGRVVGTVTLAGAEDMSGTLVEVGDTGQVAITAADGSFSIPNVPPGAHDVTASHAGYGDGTASATVTAGMTANVSLTLEPDVAPVEVSAPLLVAHGGVVHLSGSGFGDTQGASTVRFGGVPATEYLSWSDSAIDLRVPDAAPLGVKITTPVTVQVGGQSGSTAAYVLPYVPIKADGGGGSYLGLLQNGSVGVSMYDPTLDPLVDASWGHAVAGALTYDYTLLLEGDGHVEPFSCPVESDDGQCDILSGLGGVVTLVGARSHLVALKSDGTLAIWGCQREGNDAGQCAAPTDLQPVLAVAVSDFHTLALQQDGTVRAWGCGEDWAQYGQCDVPAGLSSVVALAAENEHSLAVKADGTVVAWGCGGDYPDPGPCQVPAGLDHVTAVAAGNQTSFALKDDGTVVAWGSNDPMLDEVYAAVGDLRSIAFITPFGWGGLLALDTDGHLHAIAPGEQPGGLGGPAYVFRLP